MSLLAFDAIGHDALGHGGSSASSGIVLPVTASSYTVTTSAVSFNLTDNISPAPFTITTQGATEAEIARVASASFAVSAAAPSFAFDWPVTATSLAVTLFGVLEPEGWAITPASFAISPPGVTFSEVWFVPALSPYNITVAPSITTFDDTEIICVHQELRAMNVASEIRVDMVTAEDRAMTALFEDRAMSAGPGTTDDTTYLYVLLEPRTMAAEPRKRTC